MLAIACPACGKSLKMRDEYQGKRVKCPGCGKGVNVPGEATQSSKAGNDDSLELTAGVGTQPPPGRAEETQGIVAASASKGETAVDFLAPAEGPGEIGRLGGYQVVKVLGKGGMGMVFEAIDPNLDRQVALKVMLPTIAANPSAKSRFLREAKAAAALKHDNIITIYQVGEDRGVPFLAMEFLEGKPLDAALKEGRKLTLSQILKIGREIARGLGAAHDKGLIHRDIKPANVWLDKSTGRVKILDFGLARSQQEDVQLTQSGAIVGTPAYMAPEQARGDKNLDHRVDLFSLGCLLHRLVAGELPFQGDSTMAILMALAMNDPKPLVEVPGVPQSFSDLVKRLLAKTADARPASAKEVAASIQQIEKELTQAKAVPTVPSFQLEDASPATPAAAFTAEPAPAKSSTTKREKSIAVAPTEIEEPASKSPRSKKKKSSASKGGNNRLYWMIGGGAAVLLIPLLIVLGVLMLRVETADGTLIVQVDDPAVEVLVRQGALVLKNQQEYTLKPGKGQIEVTTKDGVALYTKEFTMKKGGRETVKVTFEDLRNAKTKRPPIDSTPNPPIGPKPNPPVNPPVDPTPTKPNPLTAPVGKEIVLFDGTNLDAWQNKAWRITNGYMEITNGDNYTNQSFDNCKLHLEFWIPEQPGKSGQARGNSGIYFQDRYELQILDSYGIPVPAKNDCGSLYNTHAPLKNACKPPETWQTYDVLFIAPKPGVDGEITVYQNDVLIQDRAKFNAPTGGGRPGIGTGPIKLQFHASPIRFRNIRITPLPDDYDPSKPVKTPGAQENVPPPGFVALFNGKDLTGWQGLIEVHKRAKMSPAERDQNQKAANESILPHWTVQDGLLVYDGKGNNLQTVRDYGDFEMYCDWKIAPGGDSGIYLRGQPQVQIWDPAKKNEGSGGLYNNQKNSRVPLALADNPVGQWNTFHIKMVGDKVTVRLNGKLVVWETPLENFFERGQPLPATGPIELQHFGDQLWFKNIFLRELPGNSPKPAPAAEFFNGVDLSTFSGLPEFWSVKNGEIVGSAPKGLPFNTFLYSKSNYADFQMTFQARLSAGNNSGVQIRSIVKDPQKAVIWGPQVDMGDKYWGCLYGEQFGGMMKQADMAAVSKVIRPTEFNDYFIRAVGKRITIKINGLTTVDDEFPTAPDTGVIAFQLHAGGPINVVFRNIAFKSLSK